MTMFSINLFSVLIFRTTVVVSQFPLSFVEDVCSRVAAAAAAAATGLNSASVPGGLEGA